MANSDNSKTLLDYWCPVQGAAIDSDVSTTPVGFIATTFTFKADFFDEECLSRFLMLETEKENDRAAYLIEREEKIAGLQTGIVMVDQHNCQGNRSLRWDLVPCRINNGILHAKIAVLCWSTSVRVMIGSANLTAFGYCYNQEIFGTLDFYPGSECDPALLYEVLDYLKELVRTQCGKTVQERFHHLNSQIRKQIRQWKLEGPVRKPEIDVQLLLISPGTPDGWTVLKNKWLMSSQSPPNQAWITSPFFDSEYRIGGPSDKITEVLSQRGLVDIVYQVSSPGENEKGQKVLNAPAFLESGVRKERCHITFNEISTKGVNENNREVERPLHLKLVWLSSYDQHCMVIGSSNFTSAAWGLGMYKNYEANLVYIVKEKSTQAYKKLEAAHLNGNHVPDGEYIFEPLENLDEAGHEDFCGLPVFFGEAVIRKTDTQYKLELNFYKDEKIPEDFVISDTQGNEESVLLRNSEWNYQGQPAVFSIPWQIDKLPDQLVIKWKDERTAFWPVVIDAQQSLPPVEELRNLSFDALLYILSTSQPLYRLLDRLSKMRDKKDVHDKESTDLNAHRLVDTSRFLLQRTRRVSYAVQALRERLEKPVFTKQSLEWRLYGPVGVRSLKEAIDREIMNKEERDFLLSEVCLELSRIMPQPATNALSAREVKTAVKKAIGELSSDIAERETDNDNNFFNYCRDAVNQAMNALQ